MKTFCLILSIYVFSLSIVNCCLYEECNDNIETEYTDNHPQDHKEGDSNTCSPFLTCGTCSGFVITRLQIDINEILLIKGKSVADCKSQFSNCFINEIWQPPKIS